MSLFGGREAGRSYTRSMARWWRPWLATFTLALGLGPGCGARTGLLAPDVLTDNGNRSDRPEPMGLCVEIDPDAGLTTVNLETQPQVAVADVFFVVDRTGSMEQEIDNIKANLAAVIVPAIAATIQDVQFGVATYSDFPVDPYGDQQDQPFHLVSPVDRSVANIQGAVSGIRVGGGGDNPEALAEALYQVVTGEGYRPWIQPRSPCPTPGRIGYGCLRPNAQPIFVVVADAPSHNGPNGHAPYQNSTFLRQSLCPDGGVGCSRGPHTWAEMVAAVEGIRGRVIGISSGVAPFSGRDDLRQLAVDTRSVTARGDPLVFDIGADGRELDARVVAAVQTFTRQVRFNASARVADLDPLRPARPLVRAIRPVRAEPATQVERLDESTFYGVVPGTRLTFALDLVSDRPRTQTAQRIPARIQFLSDGRPNLGHRDLEIVIPGLDGSGCNSGPTSPDSGVNPPGDAGGGLDP